MGRHRVLSGPTLPARFIALLALLLLPAAPDAFSWGAFLGVGGLQVTDTHQLILRAAYDLLINDPRFIGLYGIPLAGGRMAAIESILQYEGVNADFSTLRPVGSGPDAEGSTLYSCHWFNPATGRGLAPQSAADWYQRFIVAISGPGGRDEDALKGLAWSAHFLADMFVPYHLVGLPADEALARNQAGNFILGPAEAGPAFFINPSPTGVQNPPEGIFGQAQRAYLDWRQRGWGLDSDFRECFKVFEANHGAAGASGNLNYLDWFDPWYWNGAAVKTMLMGQRVSDSDTDEGRAVFSSHASYEALAHNRFIQGGGYSAPFQQLPYDPLWKNAPPDYAFAGTAWQAQAWQVQDFAARAAARTLQNAELCWRQPEIGIRAAVEAVYSLWRSAYSALQPIIETGRDPARPDEGLVVQVLIRNHAYEPCHDARVRMTIRKGGAVVSQRIESVEGPVTHDGGGRAGWFAPVNPNKEWEIIAEVVGAYDRTPDLQQNMSYAEYRPEPTEQFVEPARPVEEAESEDFAGTYMLADPSRSSTAYNGTAVFRPDGTFTSVEFLNGKKIDGKGTWTFDRQTLHFNITWRPGGSFAGGVSGNTADFAIAGHWENGQAGTLRIYRR